MPYNMYLHYPPQALLFYGKTEFCCAQGGGKYRVTAACTLSMRQVGMGRVEEVYEWQHHIAG